MMKADLHSGTTGLDLSLQSTLREIIRRIVKGVQPDRIILFGSAARDECKPDSDIDLLIIKHGARRRELAGQIYRLLIGVGKAVDVIVATPEDVERYRHSPALVIEPALREGREIYVRETSSS
ncbi:MAG: nucleotidyltransferase domain-containing protein [Coprothermobacterota bacterium]|nr:nucleotidyltransferase domain-containing protein [Coprothermobacterota bacterium]